MALVGLSAAPLAFGMGWIYAVAAAAGGVLLSGFAAAIPVVTRGVQFVMGDGSARFVSETINWVTLCRLAYIHDGEPVGEF